MASCIAEACRRAGCVPLLRMLAASVGSPRRFASSLVTAMMVASSGDWSAGVPMRGSRGFRRGSPISESPSLTPAADSVSSVRARPLNTCEAQRVWLRSARGAG